MRAGRSVYVLVAAWLGGGFQTGGGTLTWGGVLPTPAVSQLLRAGGWSAGRTRSGASGGRFRRACSDRGRS